MNARLGRRIGNLLRDRRRSDSQQHARKSNLTHHATYLEIIEWDRASVRRCKGKEDRGRTASEPAASCLPADRRRLRAYRDPLAVLLPTATTTPTTPAAAAAVVTIAAVLMPWPEPLAAAAFSPPSSGAPSFR